MSALEVEPALILILTSQHKRIRSRASAREPIINRA